MENSIAIYPYPGTAPFQDRPEDRAFFFGRERQTKELLSLVLSEPQTLLFARSGVGKTSLINAGLLEGLRARGFFPVTARVTYNTSLDPVLSILTRVGEVLESHNIDLPDIKKSATLWRYFDAIQFTQGGKQLKPVLILDQFEELFTRVDAEMRERFVEQLADLSRGQAPRDIRAEAERRLDKLRDEDPERDRLLELSYGHVALDIRILISMREDFIPELEHLKRKIPTIFRNTYRLEPLSRAEAEVAIVKPSQQRDLLGEHEFTFAPGVVDEMLNYLTMHSDKEKVTSNGEVYPVQLQILCRSLFERIRQRNQKEITLLDLGGSRGMARIISRYYYDVLRKFPLVVVGWNSRRLKPALSNFYVINFPRYAIRCLCEDGLITPTGYRNSLEEGYIGSTYGVSNENLEQLINERVLRSEARLASRFFELSHDSLIKVLRNAKLRRRATVWSMIIVGVVLTTVAWQAGPTIFAEIEAWPLRATIGDARSSTEERRAAVDNLSHLFPIIDLSYLSISKLNLDGVFPNARVNLDYAQLSDSSFINSKMPLALARNAKITNVYFDQADLSGSRFYNSQIMQSSFRYADLRQANFAGSTLSNVDFTGANFGGAIEFSLPKELIRINQQDMSEPSEIKHNFVGATLRNVSFSGANLRFVDFSDTDIAKVDFTNAAWWLAAGWTPVQVSWLERSFPHENFVKTDVYLKILNDKIRMVDVYRAIGNNNKLLGMALNEVAWYRAVNGVELIQADREVSEALEREGEEVNAMDTKAYVLIQMRRFAEAKVLYDKIFKIPNSREGELLSYMQGGQAEHIYHYAVVLDYLGRSDDADKLYKLAADLKYRPTYELAFAARPVRGQ